MSHNPTISLAQQVIYSYEKSDNPFQRQQLRAMKEQIPNIKRLSLGRSVTSHMVDTDHIPTTEIIGGLTQGCFPTENQFWAEICCADYASIAGNGMDKLGALIQADNDGRGFSLFVCRSFEASNIVDQYNEDPRRHHRPIEFWRKAHCVYNETYVAITGLETVIIRIDQDGIHLPDAILDYGLEIEDRLRNGTISPATDPTSFIDDYYRYADEFSRALYVFGSPNIKHNVTSGRSDEEVDLDAKNKLRTRLKRPPLYPAQEVICERTHLDFSRSPTTVEEARALLGRTRVNRSREVRNPDGSLWLRKLDGKPWTRREHERRTKHPADRSNISRHVISSNPSQLDLRPQIRAGRRCEPE